MKFNKFQRLHCAKNNIARSYAETGYGWTNLLAIAAAAAAAACCHVMSDAISCFTLCSSRVSLTKARHKRIISFKFSESKSDSLPIGDLKDMQGLLQLVSAVIIIWFYW